MMRRIFYFAILFFVIQTFVTCAKRGNPSGGSKDSIPPIIIKYNPEIIVSTLLMMKLKSILTNTLS